GTFVNGQSGTLSLASGKSLTVTATVAGLPVVQNGVISNAGSMRVINAEVDVNEGSICGHALQIGAGSNQPGGSLASATPIGTGPACPSGQGSDQIFIPNVTAAITGDIPAGYTVAIGDSGSNCAHVAFTGAITNFGTLSAGWCS